MLERRHRMSRRELEHSGRRIANRVFHLEWYHQATYVHCFFGTPGKGEIPTVDILNHVIGSNKKLVMPRMTSISGTLEHYEVNDISSLVTNKMGIMEPSGGNRIRPEELDLILVPGLAADRQGNRIGYGKGCYDRFLAELPAVKTVMLLPASFVLDKVPKMPHDVSVRAVVTDKEVIYCN